MATSTSPGADGHPDGRPTLNPMTTDEPDDVASGRRIEKTQKILDDADDRDEEANARDAAADERTRVADRKAFTDPDPKSAYPEHGERRAAAQDRADSKTDRESSAEDRAHLSQDNR